MEGGGAELGLWWIYTGLGTSDGIHKKFSPN